MAILDSRTYAGAKKPSYVGRQASTQQQDAAHTACENNNTKDGTMWHDRGSQIAPLGLKIPNVTFTNAYPSVSNMCPNGTPHSIGYGMDISSSTPLTDSQFDKVMPNTQLLSDQASLQSRRVDAGGRLLTNDYLTMFRSDVTEMKKHINAKDNFSQDARCTEDYALPLLDNTASAKDKFISSDQQEISSVPSLRQNSPPVMKQPLVPIQPPKVMKKLRIGDTNDVIAFLESRMKLVQHIALKRLARAWIKGICPQKQARFPYSSKSPEHQIPKIPKWWPSAEVCRFKEPDHVSCIERTRLCLYLLRLRPSPEQLREWNELPDTATNATHRIRGWTAFLQELAEFEMSRVMPNEPTSRTDRRKQLIREMYKVASMEEEYLQDMRDASDIFCWHDEEAGRKPPVKRNYENAFETGNQEVSDSTPSRSQDAVLTSDVSSQLHAQPRSAPAPRSARKKPTLLTLDTTEMQCTQSTSQTSRPTAASKMASHQDMPNVQSTNIKQSISSLQLQGLESCRSNSTSTLFTPMDAHDRMNAWEDVDSKPDVHQMNAVNERFSHARIYDASPAGPELSSGYSYPTVAKRYISPQVFYAGDVPHPQFEPHPYSAACDPMGMYFSANTQNNRHADMTSVIDDDTMSMQPTPLMQANTSTNRRGAYQSSVWPFDELRPCNWYMPVCPPTDAGKKNLWHDGSNAIDPSDSDAKPH